MILQIPYFVDTPYPVIVERHVKVPIPVSVLKLLTFRFDCELIYYFLFITIIIIETVSRACACQKACVLSSLQRQETY